MRVCRVLLATRPRASCTAVTDCRYEAPSPSPASTSTSTSTRTSTAPKNARRGVCSHKHKTQPRDARSLRAPSNSPLSNISLGRGRAQRSSCVKAHEASKGDRRPADLGVLHHVCLATAAVVTAKHDRRTTRRAVVVYCIKRTAKKNAKKLQEGAPVRFLTAVGARTT